MFELDIDASIFIAEAVAVFEPLKYDNKKDL